MANAQIYMTVAGLPLSFSWEWPMRPSDAGSDWIVVHGVAKLEDGGPLRAEVAVAVTQTVKEAIGSTEEKDMEAVAINAVRKELDVKQLELLKSSKRQPVQVSSRVWDWKRNRLVFGAASDDDIRAMIRRKVYWNAKLRQSKSWIADPTDAILLNSTPEHMLELAREVEQQGLIVVDRQWATAMPALMGRGEQIENEARQALTELEKKHAFEQLRA